MHFGVSGGVFTIDDRWSQLTDALSATTEVRTSTQARVLKPAAGRIELGTDKGPVIARQVVVAIGPPAAARSLLPEPPDWPNPTALNSMSTAAAKLLTDARPGLAGIPYQMLSSLADAEDLVSRSGCVRLGPNGTHSSGPRHGGHS